MTQHDPQTELSRFPSQLREKVEQNLQDANVALKLTVVKLLADRETVDEHQVTQAGRIGLKSGQVSELTVIAPLKPGGAERLKKLFRLLDGNLFGAGKVGTLHNMRFVFLDNDTKLLFATAYDGEWDPYIDDFATRIPEMMDYIFSNIEGWPGITNPAVKGFIEQYQLPASAWYVAHPNLSVADEDRLIKQDKALHDFLDKLN